MVKGRLSWERSGEASERNAEEEEGFARAGVVKGHTLAHEETESRGIREIGIVSSNANIMNQFSGFPLTLLPRVVPLLPLREDDVGLRVTLP